MRPAAATPRKNERDTRKNQSATGDDDRRSGKLTLNQALLAAKVAVSAHGAMKRKQERARQKAMGGTVEREKVCATCSCLKRFVFELANRMAERVADVVKALMNNGMMVTQNQTIDADTAELIIEEFGHKVVRVSDADVEDVITRSKTMKDLSARPPVITIMGHVDHGKTSLAGCDPQSQGCCWRSGRHHAAYRCLSGDNRSGQVSVFLDTPGHAAFTSMRAVVRR